MLNNKSFLVVDFGAANLKLAEFELTEAGGLLLKHYAFKSLGQDGMQEATREPATVKGLLELLSEGRLQSRNVNLCAPGYHTFSKFVKLPPVDTSKVTQIIQYEAQQNVPFPLEEVVWDYQILGAAPTGELEVLLVAIKSDVVEGLFRSADNAGLRLQLVDVSPAALCNAFRYNYGDLEGCTMLLDIGARTSNLLFFDKGTVYSRGINIGANAITQDFAKEARLAYEEGERIKIEEGFVSLGGAYEEPDNAHQAAIAKISRQVLTRLHIQVNQTIQFYRGQQGGAAPERLFLSGGATSMPYTAQFFSEKLSLPVEYFNPLRNLQIDPEVPREDLAKVAHSLGEVVGLGLRNLAHCPVELNLMPRSSIKRQELAQKKPYLAASIFCLILIVFAAGWFYDRVSKKKAEILEQIEPILQVQKGNETKLKRALSEQKLAQAQVDQFTEWTMDRQYWAEVLTELRAALMVVEEEKQAEFGRPTGVWIEEFQPEMPPGYFTPTVKAKGKRPGAAPAAPARPWPPPVQGFGSTGFGSAGQSAPPPEPAKQIDTVLLVCRSVNLNKVRADAHTIIAESVAEQLRSRTNHFIAEGTNNTKLYGEILEADSTNMTFKFNIILKLVRPLKL